MISEHPDEDADSIDDEAVLSGCIDIDAVIRAPSHADRHIPDWPNRSTADTRFVVDQATMDWFRRNYGDPVAHMNLVLKSWIKARNQPLS